MIRKSKTAIQKELKEAGYRMTKHRRAIIEIITEQHDHPSVWQVYNKMKLKALGVSLATVYNTFNMLVEMNLLKEIDFEKTDNRYDTNLSPHINLVCTRCGSITDFEYDLPVKPDVIQAKEGFVTKEYRMEYRSFF